jgi:hypothetical protein
LFKGKIASVEMPTRELDLLRRIGMKYLTLKQVKDLVTSILVFTSLLLFALSALGQEPSGNAQNRRADVDTPDFATSSTTPAKLQPTFTRLTKRSDGPTSPRSPKSGDDGWQLEIRPYIWLAGIYGNVRVGNLTAETGKDSSSVLGMLDFAAAGQLEAAKGNWRLMFDENYVNLGTTATGPLGNVSIRAEPTMNIFEFGASYTVVSVPNKKATATEPLPPVFTAEVLGGGRYFHLGLKLEPTNLAAVEGSRNLVGPFVGNRFRVSPHPGLTLIGKYTVGGSGAGSNFAWSADTLADLRWKKGFSISGG